MISYAIQESLNTDEQTLIASVINTTASQLRIEAKQRKLSEFTGGVALHDKSTTLLSVGDQAWQTKFLSTVSPILRKHHEIVLAHIPIRTQKIPVRRIWLARLRAQIKRDVAMVAARKIIETPVFSCGPHLFIDTIELISSHKEPTKLHLQAELDASMYNVTCPASILRISPLHIQSSSGTTPALQLHILQPNKLNNSSSNQLL